MLITDKNLSENIENSAFHSLKEDKKSTDNEKEMVNFFSEFEIKPKNQDLSNKFITEKKNQNNEIFQEVFRTRQLSNQKNSAALFIPSPEFNAANSKHHHWIPKLIQQSEKFKDTVEFEKLLQDLKTKKEQVQKIGQKLQPDKNLTIYICSGSDLHNASWLFPSSDFLFIDNQDFGTEGHFSKNMAINFPYKENDNDSKLYQTFCEANGLVSVYITRIIQLLDSEIEGVYFFNLLENGEMEYQNPDPIKNSENGLIIYRNKNGEERKLWYLKQDLENNNEKFKKFCSKLNESGGVGNTFFKAVYDPIRAGESCRQILDIKAKCYISDASNSMIQGSVPDRFPENSTVIPINIESENFSSNVTFCYGNQLFVTKHLKSDNLYRQDIAKKFEIKMDNLKKELEKINPDLLKLSRAFQRSAFDDYLKQLERLNCNSFDNEIKLDQFFNDLEFLINSQNFDSFKRPLNLESSRDDPNPLMIKRRFSIRKPEEIWGRLGLANKYKIAFSEDSQFWNSHKSILEIYNELK